MRWRSGAKLDATVSERFRKILADPLHRPRAPAARLADQRDRYKIKLRSVGVRLVYEVRDAVLLVIVVAVGKRARNAVYHVAAQRRRRSTFDDSACVVSWAFVTGSAVLYRWLGSFREIDLGTKGRAYCDAFANVSSQRECEAIV